MSGRDMCYVEKLAKWENGRQNIFKYVLQGRLHWGGKVEDEIWMKLGVSYAEIWKKKISKQGAKLNNIRCLCFLEVILTLPGFFYIFLSIFKIILSIPKILEKFYFVGGREGWRRKETSTWNGEWKWTKCRINRKPGRPCMALYPGFPLECRT